ncbi:MAG: helix-turn-helix domain-containing protein [Gammaproteobacteria bacterium]|nr:helix-turn-helix domain-containing protein [Gammaproteobacteria bacterium]
MFDKLCDNLNLLMTEAHISADELGRRTGIPASTIKKIRNRYNPNPTLSTLLPLAQYFSITLGQLVGEESLLKGNTAGLPQTKHKTMRHLPILSWKEALCSRDSMSGELHVNVTTEYDFSQGAYALVVEDEDLENISKGTILLIDPLLGAEHRDFAIIYKEGQQLPTLKQILYDDEQIYLKPLVQGYSITRFTEEHKILGIVVEYKKLLKDIH